MNYLRLRPTMIILVVALVFMAVVIGTNHGVSALRVFDADRGTRAMVADPADAFVGVELEELYTVDQGGEFSFTIENNLGHRIDCVLDIEGAPLASVNPTSFTLWPGDVETVQVTIEEDVHGETTIVPYDVTGTLDASWDKGYSEVDLDTVVEVNPLPGEPESEDESEDGPPDSN